ncbi:MAG: hypothetical protein CfClM3_0609 [Methanobrevibacter sp. CfCl-M3]
MENLEKILKSRELPKSVVKLDDDLEVPIHGLSALEEEKLEKDLLMGLASSDKDFNELKKQLGGNTKAVIDIIGQDAFFEYLTNKKLNKVALCTDLPIELVNKFTKTEIDAIYEACEDL